MSVFTHEQHRYFTVQFRDVRTDEEEEWYYLDLREPPSGMRVPAGIRLAAEKLEPWEVGSVRVEDDGWSELRVADAAVQELRRLNEAAGFRFRLVTVTVAYHVAVGVPTEEPTWPDLQEPSKCS